MTDPSKAAAQDRADRLFIPPVGCCILPLALVCAGLLLACRSAPDEVVDREQQAAYVDRARTEELKR